MQNDTRSADVSLHYCYTLTRMERSMKHEAEDRKGENDQL